MSYALKKFPDIVDYHSIWRAKSQLICGQEFENGL
jgi:hypothetical protein